MIPHVSRQVKPLDSLILRCKREGAISLLSAIAWGVLACMTVVCKGVKHQKRLSLFMGVLLTTHVSCGKVHHFAISVADTPQKRMKGYMHKTFIPDNEGLLFVFPCKRPLCFWMKNTLVPLDILLLDDHNVVLETLENLKPHDLTSCCFKKKGLRALEIKARAIKVHVGDRVILSNALG